MTPTRFANYIKTSPTLNSETFKVCRCCGMPSPRLRRVCRFCGVKAIWDKPTDEQRLVVKAHNDERQAFIARLMTEVKA